jgi:hypothetical protein
MSGHGRSFEGRRFRNGRESPSVDIDRLDRRGQVSAAKNNLEIPWSLTIPPDEERRE